MTSRPLQVRDNRCVGIIVDRHDRYTLYVKHEPSGDAVGVPISFVDAMRMTRVGAPILIEDPHDAL